VRRRLVKAGRRSWALEPWVDWLTWNRNGGVRARWRVVSAGGRVEVLLLMREEVWLGEKDGIDIVGGVGGGDGGVGALLRGRCCGGRM